MNPALPLMIQRTGMDLPLSKALNKQHLRKLLRVKIQLQMQTNDHGR